MAEDKSGASRYTGNSNRDKEVDETPEKKVEKVIEGGAVQRKKPLGRRIAENFTGADAQSVGHYVLFEVILPRSKDLIFEVGESALRKMLFGDNAGTRSYGSYSGTQRKYTSYNNVAPAATSKLAQAGKAFMTPPSDEFGEIIVEDRGEAQNVMDKMSNLIETFGQASVSDLKYSVGLTGAFTDERFGWTSMGGTDIRRVGGQTPGYLLIFPRPEELA